MAATFVRAAEDVIQALGLMAEGWRRRWAGFIRILQAKVVTAMQQEATEFKYGSDFLEIMLDPERYVLPGSLSGRWHDSARFACWPVACPATEF